MKDLKERTLRGGCAKVSAQSANAFLRIGSLIVMARLLDPKDFGLVGMVTVVTGVFNLFKDAGLSLVTVQRPTITDEQVSTLFWINMLVGAVLAGLTVAAAPALVAFYQEPRLFWVAVALAAGFVFNAAGVQHAALLQRHMRFTAVAGAEIFAQIVSIVVGVGMAATGFGYWALVGMAISWPAAYTLAVWQTTGWVPAMPRKDTGIHSMMRFGGTVTLNGLIVYIAYNIDKVLIGRFWGAEALGIYGRAYQLVNIPTENLNYAVGGVAVSALARLQNDRVRFRAYFVKGYSLVLALSIPVTIACALLADDLIAVLLGPKWMAATVIFRFLAPTVLALALINPFGWLLFSTGRVERSLKIALMIAPLVIAGYVAGLPYGSSGVAFGYSVMMTVLIVPVIAWSKHGTVISTRDVLQAAAPPIVSAVVATVLSYGVQLVCQSWSPLARLMLTGTVLLASYSWMLLSVMGQKGFYLDLVRDVRDVTKRAA